MTIGGQTGRQSQLSYHQLVSQSTHIVTMISVTIGETDRRTCVVLVQCRQPRHSRPGPPPPQRNTAPSDEASPTHTDITYTTMSHHTCLTMIFWSFDVKTHPGMCMRPNCLRVIPRPRLFIPRLRRSSMRRRRDKTLDWETWDPWLRLETLRVTT